MTAIDPAELLMAVTGLSPFINGKPPKITIELLKRAGELPQLMTEKAAAVVRGSMKHTPMVRSHSYDQLLDRLTKKLPDHEVEAIAEAFPIEEHDLATPFQIYVVHAFDQVRGIFPTSAVQSFAGPRNVRPTADKLWSFFNIFSLLNDPMRVFELMGAASILNSQVQAFRLVYPSMAAFISSAIENATVDAKAENDKFRLPPRAEIGVARWLGRRTVDFKPPQPPQAGNQPPAKTKTNPLKNLQTTAQRASQP
jgi:hypothetical protein